MKIKKSKGTGKPPVQDVTEADTWPAPDMSLIMDAKHPAPPFPAEMLGEWEEWVQTAAESKSAPVDYVAMALLSAASSLISNVRQGLLKKGWLETTILWSALIGSPSSNKSPGVDPIREALGIIEVDLSEDYKETLKEHETKAAAAIIHREQWEKACKEAIKNNKPIPAIPDEAREPELPPRPRLCINDTTIEAAAVVMLANPRGLLLCRDELAGLLANLERHGGSDREFYLESYGGRRHTVDRKKHPEPYIIERLSIALLGTIQPDKLSRLLTETTDDGLAARFLYAWPEPVPFSESENVADQTELVEAFQKLRELPLDDGDPCKVHFSTEAKAAVLEWRSDLRAKEEKEYGIMVSFIGKMPGTVVRLAVTLAYLDWAASGKKLEPETISAVYAKRAIKLVDDYFIPMGRRALGEYAVPRKQSDARIIAKWILRYDTTTINVREMKRQRVLPTNDAERYEAAIQFLEKCDWLENANQRDGTTGRRQKTYRVNPKVFDSRPSDDARKLPKAPKPSPE